MDTAEGLEENLIPLSAAASKLLTLACKVELGRQC
jgi:hypothetical protein